MRELLSPLLRRKFRLPRIRPGQQLSRHSSSNPTSAFFIENTTPNSPRNKSLPALHHYFQEYYQNRSNFVNPYTHFNKHSVRRKPCEMVDTPPDHFQNIIDRNENNIPKEGSIVEVITSRRTTPKLGIVVRQALSRFDERYNKLLVLTTENELLDVPALDVNFHLYRVVIPRDHIDFGQIVENRHDEGDRERVAAVDFIGSFLDDVLELKRDLAPKFERVYAQFAGEAMNSITLIDVVDAIKFRETSVIKFGSSFYDQCVLLFAIHWNLIDSPKWIVPNYVPNNKLSNVTTGHSNTFHSMSEYFVTPIPVLMATTQFVHQLESSRLGQDIEVLFRKLKETPKNELSSFMEVYEGRHLVYILDFLKFALVYPHETIIKILGRTGIFKDGVTARTISDLLVELKIYDTNEDVFLSSRLVGNSSPGDESTKEYDWDNFKHLRKSKYYRDHVIYGLPLDGDESTSRFAISIEHVNARKDVINIHIPDVTTLVPPNSPIMENVFDEFSSSSSAISKLGGKHTDALFPSSFVESRKFHEHENEAAEDFWDDGLPKKKEQQQRDVTCMTISFEYALYEGDPFKSLNNKVSVSFDSISNSNVKILDRETLEKCLSGQLEQTLFKLLTRKQTPEVTEKAQLNNADIHNINYIHGVLKTFFKTREHAGAANSTPAQDIQIADASALSVDGSSVIRSTRDPSPRSDFMLKELQMFAGAMVAQYCSQNDIPIITQNQSTEPTIYDSDKVVVAHENLLMPPYESENYHHSVIAKDQHGYISLAASVVARNYLSPKRSGLTGQQNLPLGLKNGFVNVVDVFTKGEAILNQYQLLFYKHELLTRRLSMEYGYLETMSKFVDLKPRGYELRGPLSESQLSTLMRVLKKGDSRSTHLERSTKKYLTLKYLEQVKTKLDLLGRSISFRCVVTHVGEAVELGTICKCYCLDLGIEVDALTERSELSVGNELVSDGIIEIDAASGVCLLKDEKYGSFLYL